MLLLASALLVAPRAWAGDRVSITYSGVELRPVAERLASELGTDGYAVTIAENDEPSLCENPLASNDPSDGAWVRLTNDPGDGDGVIASICVRSTVSLLERVSSRGDRAEPERFALATAEALNGLRAHVPVLSSREAPSVATASADGAPPTESTSADATTRSDNQLTLAQTALLDLADLPPLWGGALAADLAVSDRVHIAFDTFIPISKIELTREDTLVAVRAAWVRSGLGLRWEAGDARVGACLLGGAAITWATAETSAPRVGAADAKLGALVTLGATLEYPSRSRVFLLAAVRASGIFPAVRVAVASDTSKTLGPVLLESSLGVGLRFGRMLEPARSD